MGPAITSGKISVAAPTPYFLYFVAKHKRFGNLDVPAMSAIRVHTSRKGHHAEARKKFTIALSKKM